ncbi:MAG: mechanosensitive ion channel family protein [Flavobacteriales bacterium]
MKNLLDILKYPFIETAHVSVTLFSIFFIIVVFAIIHIILRTVKFILTRLTSRNEDFDAAKIYTIVKLLKYVLYIIAIVLILDNLGVNINALVIGSAAFLAAIGLGLQTIFQDMVSGLVIFFEGIIHKGDILEVDGMVVQVEEINLRTSRVKNRDGNFVVVPNGKLTTNSLVNWSHQNILSRFSVTVGVAYGSDTELVKQLLIKSAESHPLTIRHKGFEVWFEEFGDSSLNFKLLFWARKSWTSETIKSDVRFAIDKAFRENNIQIPFPQRVVHMSKENS